jgi:hypothetical protein
VLAGVVVVAARAVGGTPVVLESAVAGLPRR